MNQFAREIFLRLFTLNPHVYVGAVPAVRSNEGGVVTPEVPGYFRERTDDELDVLVKYAIRAEDACIREGRRQVAANPVPRPLPISTPYPSPRMPARELSFLDRLLGSHR